MLASQGSLQDTREHCKSQFTRRRETTLRWGEVECSVLGRSLLGFFLVMAGLEVMGPALAWATHEVEHRFVVSGAVHAADGSPRSDQKVVVAHPRTQLSETVFTDRNGSYSGLLHLHDSDAGDAVTVTVADEVKTIKAAFSPADHHTPRVARVDFGLSVPERSDRSLWWYGIGGGIVVAGGLLYWRLRSRHASRRRVEGRSKSRSGGSTRAKGKSHG